jgi:D-amino-acid dehydrogenase
MVYNTRSGERDELEGAAFANELGIKTIALTGERLAAVEPLLQNNAGAVHYPGDATLSPDIFMEQMIALLKRKGVEFVEKTMINSFHENEGGVVLHTNGKAIEAKHVVVANGVWLGKLMKSHGFHLPMQDGKGYSMTMEQPVIKPRVASILHEARVAVTPMGNRLRVSGTLEISGMDDVVRMHKVRSIAEAMSAYYRDMQMQFPDNPWFGYRPCTPDGMPYIGRMHSGSKVILAGGHAMMGLSLAPATATMVRDILLYNREVDPVLHPGRFRLRSR